MVTALPGYLFQHPVSLLKLGRSDEAIRELRNVYALYANDRVDLSLRAKARLDELSQ
jgi:hypothetical protein